MDQKTYEMGRLAFAGEIEIDDTGCPVHRPTGLRLPRAFGEGPHHRDLRIKDTPIGIISWDEEVSPDEQSVRILVYCKRLRGKAALLATATDIQLGDDCLAIITAEMLRTYLERDFSMIWHPSPPPRIDFLIAD
jgi:hypothetical protein